MKEGRTRYVHLHDQIRSFLAGVMHINILCTTSSFEETRPSLLDYLESVKAPILPVLPTRRYPHYLICLNIQAHSPHPRVIFQEHRVNTHTEFNNN